MHNSTTACYNTWKYFALQVNKLNEHPVKFLVTCWCRTISCPFSLSQKKNKEINHWQGIRTWMQSAPPLDNLNSSCWISSFLLLLSLLVSRSAVWKSWVMMRLINRIPYCWHDQTDDTHYLYELRGNSVWLQTPRPLKTKKKKNHIYCRVHSKKVIQFKTHLLCQCIVTIVLQCCVPPLGRLSQNLSVLCVMFTLSSPTTPKSKAYGAPQQGFINVWKRIHKQTYVPT